MEKKLCIVYDEMFLEHKAEFMHAERPERLSAVLNYLKKNDNNKINIIIPAEASEDQIAEAHSHEYYKYIKSTADKKRGMLDPDTYFNEFSFEAALLAAGSTIKAVDLIISGEYKNVFCLVRPPGHHAEKQRAMGFCLFNNIAVGVKHASSVYGKKRITIIDWDVHHGNGTQDIFYGTDEVLFISLHQHPLYPGTGSKEETGEGRGKGFTVNYPLPPGTNGRAYLRIFEQEIIARLTEYQPEMLFISAGFDAHMEDPLANINLTSEDFSKMTVILKSFADKHNIPVISVLEGGYNLQALAESVYIHLNVLNS